MPVQFILGHQFAMFAHGNDASLVKQIDLVAFAQCRHSMGQIDYSFSRQHAAKRIVHQVLCVLVELLRRLFDYVERWVSKDGACQGDPKLFARRERVAQFADRRFISVWQPVNELLPRGELRRLDDLRQRVTWIAATNVVGDRVVEHEIVLQH